MSKPVLGLVLGGMLGILDGLTAWFTPDARAAIIGIVIGSTIKGLIAGIAIGYFAKKVHSLPLGVLFGLAIGFLLAFGVAAAQASAGQYHYFEIILPGSVLGIIVGFATQRYGQSPQLAKSASD